MSNLLHTGILDPYTYDYSTTLCVVCIIYDVKGAATEYCCVHYCMHVYVVYTLSENKENIFVNGSY